MKTWTMEEAQGNFVEILRRALANKPQRVTLGNDGVVVLSAKEYAAMAFARDLIAFVQRSGSPSGGGRQPADVRGAESEGP